jgi:filamentous hemagglutinin family protein
MNKPDKTDATASNVGQHAPRRTAVALAASRLVSTRALTRLASVLGLALLFDPLAWAQTAAPVLPVRSASGLLNGVQAPVTNGSVMSITQTNQRAIIDWQSFNIGLGSTVNVAQPGATSVLVNRVVAGSVSAGPSTINGSLQANGRIFVLDPNGVVLGSTAQVNVGGLLAAAMTMSSSDADFVNGVGLTLARDTTKQGSVRVDSGAVIAGPSGNVEVPTGDVVLLGSTSVDFNGRINATNVFIGAGGGAQIPVGDSGFVKLALTRSASTGANFVPPTVTAGTSSGITARGGSVTVATSGDGEASVTWAGNIDATGGSIAISGSAVAGTAVDILSQSDTTVPVPVQFSAASIAVTGRSDVGTGVSLANVNLAGDNVVVRGVAAPTGVVVPLNDFLPTIGVDLTNVRVDLGAAGTLTVAGRADASSAGSIGTAYGLRLNGLGVTTPDGAGKSVTLAGQGLNGTTNAGIVTSNGGGSGMFSLFGQQLDSGADVIIGASSPQNGTAFLSVPPTGGVAGLPSAPLIRTGGQVNLRPLGVDVNGNIVEQLAQPIQVESNPQLFTTPFVVPTNWIADGSFDSVGSIIAAGMVIGSARHQGLITLGANALGFDTLPLTLQNQGTGSAGVTLQGNGSTARELTVMSAGPVGQSGAIRVKRLQLQGDSTNTVTLNNEGNAIDSLGFDRLGKLDLVSHQLVSAAPIPLSLDTGTLSGYDADLDAFTAFTPTANSAASSVLVQTDVLTLNSSVTMSGSGSTMDLVAPLGFSSPGTATLSAGPGGVWRVWAPTWNTPLGSLNGDSPTPTMFGCVFGDTSTCSVSQVALPAGRSGLFFSDQPTLVVTAGSISSPRGRALPALPYTVEGLVAGNTASEAVAGALSTPATPGSAEGDYAILPGSLRSPLGYRLDFGPITSTDFPPLLTLTAAIDLPRAPLDMSMSQLLSSTSSDTYGRNLAVPSMCLAPGAARRDRAVGDGVDLLGLEWGRVRLQPQLSSCVEIATDQSCAAF